VIHQPWHVAVLIPARNEETLLPRCLRSILMSAAQLPNFVRREIIVVSDSSTDGTSEIASALLESHGTVLKARVASVGAARRLAADYVLRRHAGSLDRLWLANTDADCIVPPAWLCDQLKLADQGVEAIAGTVSVDNFEEHGPQVAERFRTSYIIRSDGSHSHVHGANLGIRGDAYLRAGGWSGLSTAEDHDLWRRLLRQGAHTVSTSRIEVETSGRRVGRAPHGFADALAAHNSEVLLA